MKSNMFTSIENQLNMFLKIFFWLLVFNIVEAQIGTTICLCYPSVYEMTFNFAQTCENTKLSGSGIASKDCGIGPFQNKNLTDVTPVVVGSIDLLELDSNLGLISQSSLFGTYRNGDSFSYTSISNDPSKINVTTYPSAIQISIIGNNKDGETLFFAGLIEYTTECNGMPSLDKGSSIGWITFSNLGPPQAAVCPISAVPTASPTSFTDAPVRSPPTLTQASEKKPRPTSVPSIPTQKPSCLLPSYPSKGFSKKSVKGSKGSKSGKGKGKGSKASKSSKGSGSGSVQSYSNSWSEGKGKGQRTKARNNVFYHGHYTECEESPTPGPPIVTNTPINPSKDDEEPRPPTQSSNDYPTARVEPSKDPRSTRSPLTRNHPSENDGISNAVNNHPANSGEPNSENYHENISGNVHPSESHEKEFVESSGFYAMLALVTCIAVAGAVTVYFWPLWKSRHQKANLQRDLRKQVPETRSDDGDRMTDFSSVLSRDDPYLDDPLLTIETKGLIAESCIHRDLSPLRL